MRIENRVNDMAMHLPKIQNRNHEKAVSESKEVQKQETVQKDAIEQKQVKPEVKAERKDIIHPETKPMEPMKTYTKDGDIKKDQVQMGTKIDVRV